MVNVVIKISTGMKLDPLNSDVKITIEGDSKKPL